MHKMAQASVFVSGMTGLGVEIGNKCIHSASHCMHNARMHDCRCIYMYMYIHMYI